MNKGLCNKTNLYILKFKYEFSKNSHPFILPYIKE